MADKSSRILMGTIGAAHGIKGEVRITSHTEDPEAIADYGPLETNRPGLTITIESARLQKTVLIARLKGVRDRNAAELLNGVELYVDRSQLPEIEDEDDFYHADLIGLDARLDSGVSIGAVSAIYDHGGRRYPGSARPTLGRHISLSLHQGRRAHGQHFRRLSGHRPAA